MTKAQNAPRKNISEGVLVRPGLGILLTGISNNYRLRTLLDDLGY